jgi:hypothetical protein
MKDEMGPRFTRFSGSGKDGGLFLKPLSIIIV